MRALDDRRFTNAMKNPLFRPTRKPDRSYFHRGNAFWAVHITLATTSALLLVWLIGSCNDIQPRAIREHIKSTQAVFDEARRQDAERYATDAMRLAEKTFKMALTEVEAQERRIFLLRSYEPGKQQLGRAKQAAYGAIYEAAAERERARHDSLVLMGEAQKLLQSLLETRARPRTGAQSWTKFDNLAGTLSDAKWAFRSGDYLTARAKAEWLLLQIKEPKS